MGVFIRQSTIVSKRGFTMAELMIAVGIIALLTISGLVSMQNQTRRARDQRRQSDLEQIRSALEMYRLSVPTRTYPTPARGEPHVVLATALGTFLPIIPRDPIASTTRRYAYQALNAGRTYQLCARLETQPVGAVQTCWNNACGAGSNTGCNVQLTQP
jgi:prepilin-type N-terminal cleavage/methylation domain-containing protein